MQLSQLRSFIAIAREQNLTRAANNLNLSQSAISSQLKALEDEFRVNLFERSTRGMRLSDEGRILLAQAEEVLAACANLQRSAESLSRGVTASVTIGLNTDPTFLRVSAINQRLSLLHSNLNVVFHASETASTAQQLKNGLIDLGFFYGTLPDPDIAQTTITHVRICVAIPNRLIRTHEQLDWDVLAELPWVWVDDKFSPYQLLATKLGYASKPPHRIVSASNEQIVRELVIAGQGVALMREDEARPLADSGEVTLWTEGWSNMPLKLGWLRDKENLPHVRNAKAAIGHIWTTGVKNLEDGHTDKAWL